MKIGPAAAYRPYQALTTGTVVPEAAANGTKTEAAAQKTDKVSLSGDASFRSVLVRMGRNMAEEVHSAASQERIQELKDEVENKTYYVSSARLADAILDSSI